MTAATLVADWSLAEPTTDKRAGLERGRLLVESTDGENPGVLVEAVLKCEPGRVFGLMSDYEQLPAAIFGLHEARVVTRTAGAVEVAFEMKLPFPVGRVRWVNRITHAEQAGLIAISWDYVGGDLERNSGRLVLAPYAQGHTYARYQVEVGMRSRLPKAAQRLATRWLLPKVVSRIRRLAEAGGERSGRPQ